MANLLQAFAALAFSSPIWTSLTLIFLLLLAVRLRTGYAKTKIHDEITAGEKEIPILPYWVPYIRHTVKFA